MYCSCHKQSYIGANLNTDINAFVHPYIDSYICSIVFSGAYIHDTNFRGQRKCNNGLNGLVHTARTDYLTQFLPSNLLSTEYLCFAVWLHNRRLHFPSIRIRYCS